MNPFFLSWQPKKRQKGGKKYVDEWIIYAYIHTCVMCTRMKEL